MRVTQGSFSYLPDLTKIEWFINFFVQNKTICQPKIEDLYSQRFVLIEYLPGGIRQFVVETMSHNKNKIKNNHTN